MLNVVDGLIGQGFPTLVLVTTNEPMRVLHPAIARSGRCAAHVEFKPFTEPEARARPRNHDVCAGERYARTLAELYAVAALLRDRQAGGFVKDGDHGVEALTDDGAGATHEPAARQCSD